MIRERFFKTCADVCIYVSFHDPHNIDDEQRRFVQSKTVRLGFLYAVAVSMKNIIPCTLNWSDDLPYVMVSYFHSSKCYIQRIVFVVL